MARAKSSPSSSQSSATIGFESRIGGIWAAADCALVNGSMKSGEGDPAKRDRALIEADLVDCMVALPGRLFYGTQIPVCPWFWGKNNTLDSANDTRLFDSETELSLVA
jgi:type I restriction-modification system DNA methylase subunit